MGNNHIPTTRRTVYYNLVDYRSDYEAKLYYLYQFKHITGELDLEKEHYYNLKTKVTDLVFKSFFNVLKEKAVVLDLDIDEGTLFEETVSAIKELITTFDSAEENGKTCIGIAEEIIKHLIHYKS